MSDQAAFWLTSGFISLLVVATIVFLAATVFWLWMIVDAITKPIENKAIWILVLLVTGVLGAIVYYFAVKRPMDQKVLG